MTFEQVHEVIFNHDLETGEIVVTHNAPIGGLVCVSGDGTLMGDDLFQIDEVAGDIVVCVENGVFRYHVESYDGDIYRTRRVS